MNSDISLPNFASIWLKFSRFRARLKCYMQIGRNDPAWLAMFTFGRIVIFRRLHSRFCRIYRKRWTNQNPTLFPDLSREVIISSLREDGIYLGITLPSEIIEQVLYFSESNVCFANSDKMRPISVSRDGIFTGASGIVVMADYHDQIFRCHAVEKLCNDGALMRIAEGYLEAPPQIARCRLWWNFFAPKATQQELNTFAQDYFHFDMDDWKCLKFFFYLTDVNERTGPHRFIRHSHQRRKLRHQLTLFKGQSTKSLARVYPQSDFLTITGPAGFGFAEDPFSFHTGTSVQEKARLMLEIEYSIADRPRAPG